MKQEEIITDLNFKLNQLSSRLEMQTKITNSYINEFEKRGLIYISELDIERKELISVNAKALSQVLTALSGPMHLTLELQCSRNIPLLKGQSENPINKLVKEYNEWSKNNELLTEQQ